MKTVLGVLAALLATTGVWAQSSVETLYVHTYWTKKQQMAIVVQPCTPQQQVTMSAIELEPFAKEREVVFAQLLKEGWKYVGWKEARSKNPTPALGGNPLIWQVQYAFERSPTGEQREYPRIPSVLDIRTELEEEEEELRQAEEERQRLDDEYHQQIMNTEVD